LFLQYRGYEVIGAILGEQTIRTLTTLGREVLGILAVIPVAVFTRHQQEQQNYGVPH